MPRSSTAVLVLDTNVISELMRPSPDLAVRRWIEGVSPEAVHTTATSVAEVRFGIARLPHGRRRDLLRTAADDIFGTFRDRVLPFDLRAATHYGDVVVERERLGAPISGFDAQIAAICRTSAATLVTRNVGDFHGLGLELLDPWTT